MNVIGFRKVRAGAVNEVNSIPARCCMHPPNRITYKYEATLSLYVLARSVQPRTS